MNIKPNPEFLESMSLELRQEWADALRSGDYEQCQQYLRNNGAYCCLGVYCELKGVNINNLLGKSEPNETKLYAGDDIFNTTCTGNPSIGLKDFGDSIGLVNASALNDTFGYSFDQIADLIHPEGIKDAT